MPVRHPTAATQVLAVGPDGVRRRPDALVTEEPMEVRVHGPGEDPVALSVTMRTPGHDFELAAGLCFTEGILAGRDDLDTVAYCLGGEGDQDFNVVTVRTRGPVVGSVAARNFVSTASCGICGKGTLDDVAVRCEPVSDDVLVPQAVLHGLPERLARHQRVFGQTGGLHAAARFTAAGDLVAAREDVGRHNALDKLVGHALLDGAVPCSGQIALVSGRVSFELVPKAAAAGMPVLCAVSAPSSLAVAAAERLGLTIVGFLRDGRFNVYSRPERLDLA